MEKWVKVAQPRSEKGQELEREARAKIKNKKFCAGESL